MAPPKKEQKALISANEMDFFLYSGYNNDFIYPIKTGRMGFIGKIIAKRSTGRAQIHLGVMWVRCSKEGVRTPVVGSSFAFRQNVLFPPSLTRGFVH